jgi:thiol-disulfide isomerase/thioredoxin
MTSFTRLRLLTAAAALAAGVAAFAQEKKETKKDPKADPDAKAAAAHDEVRLAFQDLIKDVRTNIEFRERWTRDGAAFQKKAIGFLNAYPNYEDGARSMLWLGSVFSRLGLDEPAAEMFETIAKNQSGRELGRKAAESLIALRETQAARDSAKKEFALSFVPVGSEKKFDVKDLRGKVVIVYFWAAWCDVCKPTTDEIKALVGKYGDKGLEVVGVSLDQDRAALLDALKKQGIAWPNYFDGKLWETDAARKWAINAIPTVFVLDKAGKAVTLDARGQLEELVAKHLDVKLEPEKKEKKE